MGPAAGPSPRARSGGCGPGAGRAREGRGGADQRQGRGLSPRLLRTAGPAPRPERVARAPPQPAAPLPGCSPRRRAPPVGWAAKGGAGPPVRFSLINTGADLVLRAGYPFCILTQRSELFVSFCPSSI